MHSMRLWSAAGVIAAVLIVGFLLSVPRLSDNGLKHTAATQAALPTVYFHDVFKKGTHTITVRVSAPNSCTIISGVASAEDASIIVIALSMPIDTGICLELPATTTLSFTVAASADALLDATINGSTATTTSY